jgi:hypothetical protein
MSVFTPRAILDAAAQDMLGRRHKLEGLQARGDRYCFLREHVCRADSEAQLIELALADRQRGIKSAKRTTREIYADEAVLRAALAQLRGGRAA